MLDDLLDMSKQSIEARFTLDLVSAGTGIKAGNRRTALITGAASGIGYEMSKLIAADGYDLVIVDIDEPGMLRATREITNANQSSIITIRKDLSDSRVPLEIYEELVARSIEIDLLVNNAGCGLQGKFVDLCLQDQLRMIHLNAAAVVELTGHFVPDMLRRKDGAILNVASIAAFQPGPYMAVYFATKAFVLSFSEALAKELAGTGVTVTCVCPGPTDTRFAERSGADCSPAFSPVFMMQQSAVARAAYTGLKNKRKIVIPGRLNKLVVLASRLLTSETVASVAQMLNRCIQETRGRSDNWSTPPFTRAAAAHRHSKGFD